jgi:hypothetical protein
VTTRSTIVYLAKQSYACPYKGIVSLRLIEFTSADLDLPTLKATEARLLAILTAEHGSKIYKTGFSQAFLYWDMADNKIYIQPKDLWPDIIPKGHVLQLLIYGTLAMEAA